MSELVSIQKAALRCKALIGTKDINAWTDGFLQNVCDKVEAGVVLSEKKSDKLFEIYNKHYGDHVGEEPIVLHSDRYDRG